MHTKPLFFEVLQVCFPVWRLAGKKKMNYYYYYYYYLSHNGDIISDSPNKCAKV